MYGEEDCLYLNVFTHGTKGKRPVMVYIYGGGFFSGSTQIYQPSFFMDHEDIVLVTMNYRLGPLGFINTGDGRINGNMGLKDQLLAMKWVVNNIEKFGGDAGDVTLFGESAGAASVHYHMISPASKGLFYRAILQSGAVTCPWAFMQNPRDVFLKYSKVLNCPTQNGTAMIQCLKAMDPTQMIKLQWGLMHPVNDFLMFVPSREPKTTQDPFLTENPRKLLLSGQVANNVPAMFGVTSGEGGLRTARLDAIPEGVLELEKSWNTIAPIMLVYNNSHGQYDGLSDIVKNYYFTTRNFTQYLHGFKKNFSKLASDALFFEPVHRAAKLHAKLGEPTYLYYYDYNSVLFPSTYSIFRAVRQDDWILSEIKIAWAIIVDWVKENIFGCEGPHEFGATHGDDLLQLWNVEGISGYFAGLDYDFSSKFVKSFVDFAVNKEPLQFNGHLWPPIQSTLDESDGSATPPLQYMLLGKEPKVINEPFADRMIFWESLRIRESDYNR